MKMFAVYSSSKTNCIFAFLDKMQQKPPPISGIRCSELMPSSLCPKLRVPVADFDHISPTLHDCVLGRKRDAAGQGLVSSHECSFSCWVNNIYKISWSRNIHPTKQNLISVCKCLRSRWSLSPKNMLTAGFGHEGVFSSSGLGQVLSCSFFLLS